ncbi:MAG: glycosyltransferase [Paraglaciecola sp.]|nr:glycosyltransferase [Paraglaciecola sp.]
MKPLRIAFVANNKNPKLYLQDPAFIYRCQNLALALQQAGHHAELMHISQLSAFKHFDIVLLHRPRKGLVLSWQLALLKRQGCKVIADFDDLVFLPEYAAVSPGVVNGLVSITQTEKNFRAHQQALHYCDAFSVSVLPLAEKMQQLTHKPVLCLPNAVHLTWLNMQEAEDRSTRHRLTYFPGTRSHDKDFALIKPMLEQVLAEEPELELHITGVLNTDIQCRPRQLVRHPKQSFTDYAQHVAKSWLNLAPLEESEFNRHKSALKAIEASWFNAPTLATPIPDMQRLQNAGAMLMHDSDSWYYAIKKLQDTDYYHRMSSNLRARNLDNANIEKHATAFLSFYKTL